MLPFLIAMKLTLAAQPTALAAAHLAPALKAEALGIDSAEAPAPDLNAAPAFTGLRIGRVIGTSLAVYDGYGAAIGVGALIWRQNQGDHFSNGIWGIVVGGVVAVFLPGLMGVKLASDIHPDGYDSQGGWQAYALTLAAIPLSLAAMAIPVFGLVLGPAGLLIGVPAICLHFVKWVPPASEPPAPQPGKVEGTALGGDRDARPTASLMADASQPAARADVSGTRIASLLSVPF